MPEFKKLIIHSNLSPLQRGGIPYVVRGQIDWARQRFPDLEINIVYGGDETDEELEQSHFFRRIARLWGLDFWQFGGFGILRHVNKQTLFFV